MNNFDPRIQGCPCYSCATTQAERDRRLYEAGRRAASQTVLLSPCPDCGRNENGLHFMECERKLAQVVVNTELDVITIDIDALMRKYGVKEIRLIKAGWI